MRKYHVLILVTFCFFGTQLAKAQKALSLQSYRVEYKIKNAGLNTSGRFDKVSAEVVFDENNLDKSSISATIQVNSLNSGIGMRDKHLKGDDYFDAEKYPTITLRSTKLTKSGNIYLGTFNLIIKGVTQSIQFPFTVTKKDNTFEFEATEFSVDRLTYGIGKSSVVLSNMVHLRIKATFSM